VGDNRSPLAERQVGADRRSVLALGDDLEQRLSATRVDVDVVDLIEK
jgi:hypothetical protein